MRIETTTLLFCLAAALALAAPAAQAQRAYQVELVVFAHPAGSSVERAPRADAVEPPASARRLLEGEPEGDEEFIDLTAMLAGPQDPAAPAVLPAGFLAPANPLALRNVAARLNTGGYRLLWHQAWVQPATGRSNVDLELLATLGKGHATPGLTGTIQLAARRFLHLGVDLEWQSAGTVEAHMREQRRMRLNEEHYLDHGRIGVIAVVTPLGASESQDAPNP
jgi:hypothetical protein